MLIISFHRSGFEHVLLLLIFLKIRKLFFYLSGFEHVLLLLIFLKIWKLIFTFQDLSMFYCCWYSWISESYFFTFQDLSMFYCCWYSWRFESLMLAKASPLNCRFLDCHHSAEVPAEINLVQKSQGQKFVVKTSMVTVVILT